jgi:glutaredoxin
MVTPTSFRKSQEQSARAPLSRRGLLSLIVTVATVWGLSQAWSAWHSAAQASTIKAMAAGSNIVMYTTSTCPYCARARDWLATHEVGYRDCNVDVDEQCMAQYTAKGQPGVPLMNVNDHWQLGFDPQWLAEALQSTGPQASKSQP